MQHGLFINFSFQISKVRVGLQRLHPKNVCSAKPNGIKENKANLSQFFQGKLHIWINHSFMGQETHPEIQQYVSGTLQALFVNHVSGATQGP